MAFGSPAVERAHTLQRRWKKTLTAPGNLAEDTAVRGGGVVVEDGGGGSGFERREEREE